jgi:hypothetical protein
MTFLALYNGILINNQNFPLKYLEVNGIIRYFVLGFRKQTNIIPISNRKYGRLLNYLCTRIYVANLISRFKDREFSLRNKQNPDKLRLRCQKSLKL